MEKIMLKYNKYLKITNQAKFSDQTELSISPNFLIVFI